MVPTAKHIVPLKSSRADPSCTKYKACKMLSVDGVSTTVCTMFRHHTTLNYDDAILFFNMVQNLLTKVLSSSTSKHTVPILGISSKMVQILINVMATINLIQKNFQAPKQISTASARSRYVWSEIKTWLLDENRNAIYPHT